MKKCLKYCQVCPFVKEGKKITGNNFSWNIMKPFNCDTSNIVYIVFCDKNNCKQQYVGESDRQFRTRMLEHINYVRNKNLKTATGYHFNLPGHSIENMKFSIIEQVRKRNNIYRKEREKYHINNFNTFYKGINRML